MAKVWIESEYYLNLESEDKIITLRLSQGYLTIVNFSLNFVWICLSAVWILIAKRLKWRQNIAKTKHNLASTKTRKCVIVNSAFSIAKIFDFDNKEVKLKYHPQTNNYLESLICYYISIYEPKMKYKNSLNH